MGQVRMEDRCYCVFSSLKNPEKINDEVVETLMEMRDRAPVASELALTGLIGVGELMKLAAINEENESYKADIHRDDLIETLYKVGCLVESLGVMIHECSEMKSRAELALESKKAFDEGKLNPGNLRPDGTRFLEDQKN